MKDRIECSLSGKSDHMSRCGIGPKFSIITVVMGLLLGWLTFQYPGAFKIRWIPLWVFQVAGAVFVAGGVLLYSISLKTFFEGYRGGSLVTHGPYAYIRHPLYAAWILLICPGVVLFFQSWLMLLLPIIAYGSFKALIHHEDRHLEKRYGKVYRDYRTRTSELFPIRFVVEKYKDK